jgi:hypothetical protein
MNDQIKITLEDLDNHVQRAIAQYASNAVKNQVDFSRCEPLIKKAFAGLFESGDIAARIPWVVQIAVEKAVDQALEEAGTTAFLRSVAVDYLNSEEFKAAASEKVKGILLDKVGVP